MKLSFARKSARLLPLLCAAFLAACAHHGIKQEQQSVQLLPEPAAQTDVCAGLAQPQIIAAQAASTASGGDFAKAYATMQQAVDCKTPASEKFRYADLAKYAFMLGKYTEAEKYAQTDRDELATQRRFLLEGVELRDGNFILSSVTPQAQAAGLKEDDEITAIHGGFTKGMTLEEFRAATINGKPGETVPLAIIRAGSETKVKLRLPIQSADDGRAAGILALAKYFQGDLRSAAVLARQTLVLNPKNPEAVMALGLVKTDAEEAVSALKLLPDDGAFATLIRAYAFASQQKTYQGVDAYSTIDPLLKDGGFPPVMELRNRVSKLIAADRDEAQQDCAKLDEQKNYRGEFLTMALLSRMPGSAEEEAKARADMFAFAVKYPKAAQLSKQIAALAQAGEENSKKEDFIAALPSLRKAVLLAPWNAQVRCSYAVALAKTGDFAHARYHAALCAAAGPDNPEAAGLSANIDLWEKEWHPGTKPEPQATQSPAKKQPAADAAAPAPENSDENAD